MSTQSDDPRGSGWLLFAATMLGLTGSLNALIGLAAIGQSRVFAGDAAFVIGNLRAWGWILLAVGVAQVAAAFGIGGRAPWGRWSGIGLAGLRCGWAVRMPVGRRHAVRRRAMPALHDAVATAPPVRAGVDQRVGVGAPVRERVGVAGRRAGPSAVVDQLAEQRVADERCAAGHRTDRHRPAGVGGASGCSRG